MYATLRIPFAIGAAAYRFDWAFLLQVRDGWTYSAACRSGKRVRKLPLSADGIKV